nr:Gag-Pol polyprotein [Tanacetum cinerariifolium]
MSFDAFDKETGSSDGLQPKQVDLNETPAEKVAKRKKLDEEVEKLKRHLQLVPNGDDDVYTEATPLARKVPVVDYKIIEQNNKPYYKIIRADERKYPLKRFTLDQMLNAVRLKVKEESEVSLELLRTPSIGFMRPFGCPVTILNTLDSSGKFDGKVDEGFLVGYSVSSKAFRVFNSRTRIIQETLHVNFLENKPNVAGSGPTWLFDIDSLTKTISYQPVTAGNQSDPSAGFQDKFDAEKAGEEINQQYVLFLVWSSGFTNPQNTDRDDAFDEKEPEFDEKKHESEVIVSPSSSAQSKKQDEKTTSEAKGKSPVESFTGNKDLSVEFEDLSDNRINEVNVADAFQLPDDLDMPELEDITYFDDEDDVGAEADFNNLETSITVSPIPTTRVHEDHHAKLLQLKIQKVWILVDFLYEKRAIGFEDPDHPDKVYKVVNALYGLHQAPRAWYETLANYLLENDFQRGKIDQTLFIKRQKGDILLVQIYVDDIIFDGKSASTPIDTEKPLLKDPNGEDVDVHTYRSMIGSLMYLTSSRPDIMFAVQPPSPQPQQQPQPIQDARIPMNLLQEVMDNCTTLSRRVEHLEFNKIAQALEMTSLKRWVKKLERRNKVKVLKLRRLQKVETTQRVETSDETVMDDVSNQERMIAEMDQDADVVLEDDKEVVDDAKSDQDAKVDESVDIHGRKAESQAEIYKIDLEHANKVLSMHEDESDPAEVQEVVDVVITAKIITEVVTVSSETITAASTTITAAEDQVPVLHLLLLHQELLLLLDKGKGILVEEPKPLKKQAQIKQDEQYARELKAELNRTKDWDETEAQAKKNMMIYLKNVAGFKMDYFKGMYYDDIRPIFEVKFNKNMAFLLKTKEQIEKEQSKALKRLNETPAEKAAKR